MKRIGNYRKPIASLEELHAKCEAAPSGCIEYRGNGRGIRHRYGVVKTTHGRMTVARAAKFFATLSPIPDEMEACHTCDNPRCTNPSHIFIAPHSANMEDKRQKGRARKASTLPSETVLEILRMRAAGDLIQAIASKFGLHEVSVGYICTGKRHRKIWKQFHTQFATT